MCVWRLEHALESGADIHSHPSGFGAPSLARCYRLGHKGTGARASQAAGRQTTQMILIREQKLWRKSERREREGTINAHISEHPNRFGVPPGSLLPSRTQGHCESSDWTPNHLDDREQRR